MPAIWCNFISTDVAAIPFQSNSGIKSSTRFRSSISGTRPSIRPLCEPATLYIFLYLALCQVTSPGRKLLSIHRIYIFRRRREIQICYCASGDICRQRALLSTFDSARWQAWKAWKVQYFHISFAALRAKFGRKSAGAGRPGVRDDNTKLCPPGMFQARGVVRKLRS